MTRKDRNIKLKHLITCMKCEVSGKVCDENCPTQYEAGNMGEIIENLEAISEILEQESCEDCISRQAALNLFNYTNTKGDVWHGIKDLPPVTPKEKTGHWEYVQYDGNPNIGNLHCSECERIAGFEYNFCPNCGARMVSK